MRFIPSLIGAATAASLLFSSTLPALSQASSGNPSKPPVAKWDPSKINRKLSLGSQAARQALSYRGVPYHFGGQSRKGIDCSGLIQSAFKQWGILLPRTSVEQHKKGIAVAKAQMKPGDLVFFKNTYKRGISHVGIYVGDNQFVHASSGRGRVTVSSLADPYYQNHWAGARRVALEKEPVYASDDRDEEGDTRVLASDDEKRTSGPISLQVPVAEENPSAREPVR